MFPAGVHRSAYLANYKLCQCRYPTTRRPRPPGPTRAKLVAAFHERGQSACRYWRIQEHAHHASPRYRHDSECSKPKGGPCIGTCHESGRGSAELGKLCIGPQHAPGHSSSASRQTFSAACRTASRTSMPHCMGNLAKPTKPLSPRVAHQALHGLKLHSGRHLGPVHLLVAGLAHVVVAAGFRASVGRAADSTHVASAAHDTC